MSPSIADGVVESDEQKAQKLINDGLVLHQGGALLAAEAKYQEVLKINPNNAHCLFLYGILFHHTGRLSAAVTAINASIAINQDNPFSHYNLAIVLGDLGRLDEAEVRYRRALAIKPDYVEAHYNLANTLKDLGRLEEAIAGYRQALGIKPDYAEVYCNLGNALKHCGRLDEATVSYRQALGIKPDYAEAHSNLGNALHDLGRLDEAEACYGRALGIKPDYAEAHYNLGNTLHDLGRLDQAEACYRRALMINPNYADAYYNLGNTLQDLDRLSEAEANYRLAISRRPESAEAHSNLGNTLKRTGRRDEAMVSYQRALAIKPDFVEVHWNEGLLRLLTGEFLLGWQKYEYRWQKKDAKPPGHQQVPWDGAPLEGKTILIYCEQGLGDSIQFIRYIPLVKARGAMIAVLCPKPLQRLFVSVTEIDHLLTDENDIPHCDYQIPLITLPLAFKTELATIPNVIPYLSTCPISTEKWSQRLGKLAGIKVGIAWRGNPKHKNDRNRSIHPKVLSKIIKTSGCIFISLQKNAKDDDLAVFSGRQNYIDIAGELDDFADTAAVIENLDLVISVDTSIAHLAGALGKPVWIFLPFDPDWRWLLDRNDSPWYPSVRLFRQSRIGDWTSVIDAAAQCLAEHSVRRAACGPRRVLQTIKSLIIKLSSRKSSGS